MKNQQAVKSFLFLAALLCGTFFVCGKATAAGNAKSFFKPETAASSSKDGSIFPGGECSNIYFIVLSIRIIDRHKIIKKKSDTLVIFKIC